MSTETESLKHSVKIIYSPRSTNTSESYRIKLIIDDKVRKYKVISPIKLKYRDNPTSDSINLFDYANKINIEQNFVVPPLDSIKFYTPRSLIFIKNIESLVITVPPNPPKSEPQPKQKRKNNGLFDPPTRNRSC